jgi:hypothetical protein
MRSRTMIFISGLALTVFVACGQQGSTKNIKEAENRILQQEDGTVSLKLDKAECYSDAVNPSNNTADWNIVISKPGRFKVWLSSATKDTSTLSYSGSVKVNILDDHLEVDPAVDKIVQNSADVPSSYFRADSYVGSFYVPEAGEYNVQVICDKVITKNSGTQNNSKLDDTKLMSVILTPALR